VNDCPAAEDILGHTNGASDAHTDMTANCCRKSTFSCDVNSDCCSGTCSSGTCSS
jgi:hypothetical protein